MLASHRLVCEPVALTVLYHSQSSIPRTTTVEGDFGSTEPLPHEMSGDGTRDSSVLPSPSSTSPLVQEGRRSMSVHFDLRATIAHLIEQRQDLSEHETAAVWYSKAEYFDIQNEVLATLKVISAGFTNPDRGNFCYRGLEYKTPEMRQRRASNVIVSYKAVFSAQRLLRKKKKQSSDHGSDDTDDTLIARTYQACSRQCQADAHLVGIWDARATSLLWREDQSPKIPRRTCWAKAG
jgi:hypothetical protein